MPQGVGSRSITESIAERLAARGWVTRLTSRRSGRLGRVADIVTTVRRERRGVDVACVDLFSGAAFRWAEWACTLLRAAGTPTVITLHGGDLPAFARKHSARVRRLLGGAAAVTAPSAYLAEALGSFRSDIEVIPNPLDLTAIRYRERSALQPRLVWVRTFHRIYNPALAPEVVARLAGRHPGLRLVMVGPDKDGSLAATQETARRLGVADRITCTGGVPHEEVPRHLAAADLFVNTTDVDNTPVSVLEAMAAGLPVVTTDAGGLPQLVRDGRDALVVPRGDAAAMAEAVGRLLDDPSLAGALSREGRLRATACDWAVVLPRWEALLADVAAAGRARHA